MRSLSLFCVCFLFACCRHDSVWIGVYADATSRSDSCHTRACFLHFPLGSSVCFILNCTYSNLSAFCLFRSIVVLRVNISVLLCLVRKYIRLFSSFFSLLINMILYLLLNRVLFFVMNSHQLPFAFLFLDRVHIFAGCCSRGSAQWWLLTLASVWCSTRPLWSVIFSVCVFV